VHYINGASTAQCPGTAANPTATSGNLCVYQQGNVGTTGSAGFEGTSIFGTGIFFSTPAGTSYSGFDGTWAVTG
jgi:hypothetical protein